MKKFTLTIALLFVAIIGMNQVFAQSQGEFDFSKGENYYLIYLDEETEARIPAGQIAKDYRVDDTTHWLYIWEDTYTSNNAIGPNSNGVPGAFLDFTVGNVGWSGYGFASTEPGKDMSGIDESYYLHVALKSKGTQGHMIIVSGEENKEAKIVLGSAPFADDSGTYDPYGNFPRDGEWYYFDIPVSTLVKMGAAFTSKEFTGNVFSMLSGGVQGTNICIDAIFFYRLPGSGNSIDNVSSDEVQIVMGASTISVIGSEMGINLYDISGNLVKTSKESIIGTEGMNQGIYILKTGNVVKKVLIK